MSWWNMYDTELKHVKTRHYIYYYHYYHYYYYCYYCYYYYVLNQHKYHETSSDIYNETTCVIGECIQSTDACKTTSSIWIHNVVCFIVSFTIQNKTMLCIYIYDIEQGKIDIYNIEPCVYMYNMKLNYTK